MWIKSKGSYSNFPIYLCYMIEDYKIIIISCDSESDYKYSAFIKSYPNENNGLDVSHIGPKGSFHYFYPTEKIVGNDLDVIKLESLLKAKEVGWDIKSLV